MTRIALVTGGNRGIGFEICRQLAKLGMQVILTSRDPARGEQAADALRAEGAEIISYPLDVTSEASVDEVRQYVLDSYGRLDVLVNNAGIYEDEGMSIFDISFELLQETMAINTFGPFLLCKAFVPVMRQHNYGRVVNVSSGYGSITDMGGYTGAYKMSKVALNALTRILAAEVRGTNVKVNVMDPGWVRTDMGGRGAPRSPQQGADTAVWLATLPDDGPTGGFFYDRKPTAW